MIILNVRNWFTNVYCTTCNSVLEMPLFGNISENRIARVSAFRLEV
jgi:hypothetical protein